MGEFSGNLMPSQMQSIAMRVTAQVRHCMAAAIMASVRAYAGTHTVAKSMSAIPTATIPTAAISTAAIPTAATASAAAAAAVREDWVS